MILEDTRLKVFLAVAAHRSFTVAARKLELSQSAVSQCIADLEKRAGRTLFVRTKGDVSLTPEGETFRIFAERIVKCYEDLDVVFNDYDAYASVAQQLASLRSEPAFTLFKDKLL